jgi:hypothetical protein
MSVGETYRKDFSEPAVQDVYAITLYEQRANCYSVLKACDGFVEAAR